MVTEVLVGLDCRPGCLYVDGTVGEGGHAAAILDRTAPGGQLWGMDQDPAVLAVAATRLARHTSRFRLFHSSYARLGELLTAHQVPGVSGILLDLGLSSFQLQRSHRGFSFQGEEPLDMRFNPDSGDLSAAQLLNQASPATKKRSSANMGKSPGPGVWPG